MHDHIPFLFALIVGPSLLLIWIGMIAHEAKKEYKNILRNDDKVR